MRVPFSPHPENMFADIITENFPNLGKEADIQVQEVQKIPYRVNPKRNTPRHIVIKMTKIEDKERILKAAREKQQTTYRRIPIRLSADFSEETLQARRERHDIFKVMKGKNNQEYPARFSFRYDGEIKSFTDKQKLREFSTTKPGL